MSITQQPNGRWKVVVDVASRRNDGRRARVVRTVDTEAEGEALVEVLRGRAPELNDMTVAGLCDHYVTLRGPDLDPQTDNQYRAQIRLYFTPTWIGQVPFDQLTLEQVRRFYAQLRDGTYLDDNPAAKRLRRRPVRPLADKTVRGIHNFLSTVYNDAVDLGWIDRNPVRNARRRTNKQRHDAGHARKRYSLADVSTVLAHADEDMADLMQLEILTGARIGELAALRWRDIDFAAQTVTIDASVSKRRNTDAFRAGTYFRKSTKTGDVRVLGLDDATIAMLQERFARHAQQADDVGVAPETLDGRAVFSRTLEEDFTSTLALRGQWNMTLARAGVHLRFHDLRHIVCSEMIAAGVPVPNATARSGHASNQVFFDVYGHARRDTTDPALDALSAVWRRIRTV